MTKQEVEKILGGPQGDYSGGRRFTFTPKPPDWGGFDWQTWVGQDLAITVVFDHDELATEIFRTEVFERRRGD
jgi:hypothetical protein